MARALRHSYTFGHDIEATWLLCEAAEVLGDAAFAEASARQVALPMAEVVLQEGIDADGALRYEGRGGKIIDAGKECWPQAEAVIGFLNAFQISRDEKYLNAALRVWDFIENHLVDRVHGEWFWRITPEGQVDADAAEGQRMERPVSRVPDVSGNAPPVARHRRGELKLLLTTFSAQAERGLSSIRSG